MEENGHVRVILDVERAGVPIRGFISVSHERQRPFHGWLELADALEAARAGALTTEPVANDLGVPLTLSEPEPPAVERCASATHQSARVLERRR